MCSDRRVHRRRDHDDDVTEGQRALLAAQHGVAKDPGAIAAFLHASEGRPRVSLLLTTYQSSADVGEGASMARRTFDFAFFDEAHHTVKESPGRRDTCYQFALRDDKDWLGKGVNATRRVFLTATPRRPRRARDGSLHDKDGDLLEAVTMDQREVYGPHFRLELGDAVDLDRPGRGIVLPTRVVVGIVRDSEKLREAILASDRDLAEDHIQKLLEHAGLAKQLDAIAEEQGGGAVLLRLRERPDPRGRRSTPARRRTPGRAREGRAPRPRPGNERTPRSRGGARR